MVVSEGKVGSIRPVGTLQRSHIRGLAGVAFRGRKRVHNADELISAIVAMRMVEHLERAGFVVMKRPAIGGGAALGRGFEG
jgi:hypothetical protein